MYDYSCRISFFFIFQILDFFFFNFFLCVILNMTLNINSVDYYMVDLNDFGNCKIEFQMKLPYLL